MSKYIFKRLLLSIITIWAVITITFVLMNTVPGNPFANENRRIPENIYENLIRKYGLDKPKSEQYITYLKNIARFDFGESMRSDAETVNEMINRGFPVSAALGFEALLISLIFGPILGTIAALYQNKTPDYISMIISIIGVSVPGFLMGTFLIQFIATKFDWVPIGGWGEFRHTILPSITLAMMPLAQISRLMRSGMLEILNQN
jgi:ABC-type dipeptide/oligopeptide/nickel transport system permease component